ncbi:diacylglycerol kinase family lipid kinase [Massilia cavernae]|uniref:Diacylglycerol kinase family lipid kinase n=2 Tax=Massilia cavernae TaxID=2320864 RepID=A0A418Y687_9BURK|nr:diacylglycerol kinase family protein [Massilia cavernae]RJG23456.1 diacylglycerol kinase family lipid kinase [Massilia cavernae]
MPSHIAVIINASAGFGYTTEWADALAEKFRSNGTNARVILAHSGDEIVDAAKSAVADRPDVIVAGGGDGTINAVASCLIGTDIPFGVLPLGTLNHFAKDLRIPLGLDEAVANIAAGNSINIDAGEVNGRLFLNNSSLGLYPDIVRDREKQQKRLGRGKWTAFFWATMTTLRRYPFLNVTIGVNKDKHRRRSPFVFVGNNEYLMEGFNIGVRERLDAGRLCLYVTHRTGRMGLFMLAMRALFGRLRGARDFDGVAATDLLIETRRKRMRVATDGEVTIMETPLRYRIRPGALRVIVPERAGPREADGAGTHARVASVL